MASGVSSLGRSTDTVSAETVVSTDSSKEYHSAGSSAGGAGTSPQSGVGIFTGQISNLSALINYLDDLIENLAINDILNKFCDKIIIEFDKCVNIPTPVLDPTRQNSEFSDTHD